MDFTQIIKDYRQREMISQQELADMLGVSFVSVNRWENGHYKPTQKVKRKLLNLYYGMPKVISSNQEVIKECAINNRRYLGNKFKLLPFIKSVVEENCKGIKSFADIFSGTGAVASAFQNLNLVTNDILYSNYICNLAWFGPEKVRKDYLIELISFFNSIEVDENNYMTQNFSNTYFSRSDCSKIGYIREGIEEKYKLKEINERERAVLITSLIYAMDRIAKTCGHYDAFIKGSKYDKHLVLDYPNVPIVNNENNLCFNEDANKLVNGLHCDLVYIDPPYNSRQYCDAYHLLENVARWDKPKVFGVARKMDRKRIKSDYCTKSAVTAFEDLIRRIHTKYILLSYNNMGEKGNDRSNAKISDSDIKRILGEKGKVIVFSQAHKPFSTGKSNIENNEERLFLCICKGAN